MKQQVLELIQKKRPWLIAIGVLLFMNILASVLIGMIQVPALDQKKVAWSEQRKRLDALARGDVTTAYRNAKADLEKIQAMIPEKRRFPSLLGEIMESSAACTVSTGAITYKPKSIKEQKLLAYEITMSVSGRYSAVRCFLYKMQTMEDLVVIDGIRLSNENPYAEDVTMELGLTAYLKDGV
jgi:hypothetical protein